MGKLLSTQGKISKSILFCGAESTGKTYLVSKIRSFLHSNDEEEEHIENYTHKRTEGISKVTKDLKRLRLSTKNRNSYSGILEGLLEFMREEVYNSVRINTLVYIIRVTKERFEDEALEDLKFLVNEYQLYDTDFAIVFNVFSHKFSSKEKRVDIVGDMSLNFFCQKGVDVTEEFKGYFKDKFSSILDYLNERSFKFFLVNIEELGQQKGLDEVEAQSKKDELKEIADWILFDNKS